MNRKKPAYSVLIVDDDRDMCVSLEDVISLDTDYEVTTCSSPGKAIEILKKKEFSLLIIDYKMPDMNGVEAVNAMRKIRPGLAVIVLTAFLSTELVDEAKRSGIDTVLSKFIWPDELLRQIGAELKKPR